MPESQENRGNGQGKVYLVGAGPGDPGLITVKGLEALRTADAIVYDRLASPRLLAEARLDAQRSEAFARDNPRRPRRPDADVAADSPADGGAQSQGNAQ